MRAIVLTAFVMLAGCASTTPATTLYGDVLVTARQGATGASSPTRLRAEAIADAETHCASAGRKMEMVEIVEARPPFVLGNFPKAEVRFRCVSV